MCPILLRFLGCSRTASSSEVAFKGELHELLNSKTIDIFYIACEVMDDKWTPVLFTCSVTFNTLINENMLLCFLFFFFFFAFLGFSVTFNTLIILFSRPNRKYYKGTEIPENLISQHPIVPHRIPLTAMKIENNKTTLRLKTITRLLYTSQKKLP